MNDHSSTNARSDQAFRDAMRRLAGTVTIITVFDQGQRHGSTATAVTSLSMAPPSLLVCMNKDSRLHGYLTRVDGFCVNLLHTDNVDASRQFASPLSSEERFAAGDWRVEDGGAPYLFDAQASLQCIKDKMVDYGTHTIFIGRVGLVRLRDDIAPLLYCDGDYAGSVQLAEQRQARVIKS